MNCLCNLFDNEVVWLIIIALLLLNATCNDCGGGIFPARGGCGCGSNYNTGCGCGCNG